MRTPRLPRILAALGLAAALVLGGCARGTSTATTEQTTVKTTTAAPPAAPAGPYGTLNIALSTFGSENFYPPTTEQGVIMTLLPPMFDFLVGLKGTQLAPAALDSWEMAPDGLSWLYRLHQGMKFHDGAEVTSADLKFSLDKYVGADAVSTDLKASVDHADIVDKYSVRVFTKGPALDLPAFSMVIAPSRGLVIPKAYIERNGADYFKQHPVGSGPWKFVSRIGGDSITFEAFADYWGQKASFKTLKLLMIPEETTRIAMLKTRGLDVTEVGTDSARDLKAAGYKTFVTQWFSPMVFLTGAYLPAAAGMPIADVRVRQALSLAINRDEIQKTFFYGTAIPAGPPNISEISRDVNLDYWMKYAATTINRYDPMEASKLLKDAGYAQGFNIDLWNFTMQGAAYLPKLAEVVQGYWSKIGVKANLVPSDWGSYQKLILTKPINAQIVGQASTVRSDAGMFTKKNLDQFFGANGLFTLFGNGKPDFDKLMSDALFEPSPAKRKELFDKALRIVADTYVDIMIVSAPSQAAIGPGVDIPYPEPAAYSMGLYANLAKHK